MMKYPRANLAEGYRYLVYPVALRKELSMIVIRKQINRMGSRRVFQNDEATAFLARRRRRGLTGPCCSECMVSAVISIASRRPKAASQDGDQPVESSTSPSASSRGMSPSLSFDMTAISLALSLCRRAASVAA